MKLIFILIPLWIFVTPVMAELKLEPIHPDEPVDYTFQTRYSPANTLKSLESIRSALKSFTMLTEELKGRMDKQILQKVGNTDWETQYLGFPNHATSIEGTLYKYDYPVKKLTYELELEKAKIHHSTNLKLDKAKQDLEKAEKAFQTFWNGSGIRD